MRRALLYTICLLLMPQLGLAQGADALLDTLHQLRHKDPRAAIKLIEQQLTHADDTNQDQRLALNFQLFRLYITLGDNAKAEDIVQSLQADVASAKYKDAWIALMEAYLKLIHFKSDEVRTLLDPFIAIYQQSGDVLLSAWHQFIEGALQVRKNNYDEALTYLTQSQQYALSIGNDAIDLVVLDQLANVAYYMKGYNKALGYNQSMLQKARKLGDQFATAKGLSTEMNIYYMKSLEARDSVDEQSSEADIQNAREKQKTFGEKAEALELELLRLSRQIGAFRIEIRALINKLNRSLQKKQFTKSVEVAKDAVKLADRHNLTFEKAVSYNNMAIAYRALKQHENGINALKKAEEGYAKINNDQYSLWILEDYALAFETNKQFDKALEYYKKYHLADTKLLQKTNNKTVLELQEKFDSLEKEREIRRLNQENQLKQAKISHQRTQIFLFTSLGVAIFLILLLQYNRSVVINRKNKKLDVLNRRLKDLSLKDPLTGLYNRRMLDELEDQFANSSLPDVKIQSGNEISIGVVMLDIDNFKKVNDTYGHDTGDEVIKHVSKEISAELRRGDIAIRLGGEEFLVVLFDIDEQGISSFCSRILQTRNENPVTVGNNTLPITSSLGYIVFPFAIDNSAWSSWEETIKIADSLLYQAKRNGRNRAETLVFPNNLGHMNKKFIIENLANNNEDLPESIQAKTLTYPIAC